jgi:choloylglycine hydrolase
MRKLSAVLVTLIALSSLAPLADACTRVLWPTKMGVVVGRNMDWFEDTKSNIWVFPRGIERNGLADVNPLKWTSRHGSVITTIYDIGTVDGLNEKGLAANVLYLTESDYGKRDDKVPGLSISLWAQYYLDQFVSVKEALHSTEVHPYQIITGMLGGSGRKASGHLALSDKTGDSAIIEFVDGKIQIYHGRQYRTMTNSPTFDKQLANLKQYKGFGGDKELPGSNLAADRFVRAAYYESQLPAPKTRREAVGGVWSVMRNAAAPFGVRPGPNTPNLSATLWTTVADMSNGIYYYGATMSPTIFWVELNKIDFKKGAPILKLDVVGNPDRIGDVTAQFASSKPFTFMKP